MKFPVLAATLLATFASHTAQAADIYSCTQLDHKVSITLDVTTRLMSVTREDGVTDRGFFVERQTPDVPYVEYYLLNDLVSGAYYFRLWNDHSDKAEFQFCWNCAVFPCTRVSSPVES